MALYPGATQRLIPKWNATPITRYRRMNLHVAVADADSIHDIFARSESACSHFYVAYDGTVEQYIDTRYRSVSDLHGNDSTISVETAGGTSNVNGQKWTDAQVVALAKLWAWARDTHDIPNKMATGTNTNEASSGLSWHRLGIRGNFSGRPGMCAVSYGGILYSSSFGKECPGDAKILQIPEIFVKADDAGGINLDPVGSITPEEEGLTMADISKITDAIASLSKKIEERPSLGDMRLMVERAVKTRASAAQLKSVYTRQREYQAATQEAIAQIAKATGTDLDLDAISNAAREGAQAGAAEAVEEFAEGVDVTLTVDPKSDD